MSDDVLLAVENSIRQGRLKEAAAVLKGLEPAALPAATRARCANLCRRAGLPALGLRILRPRIFDVKSGAPLDASGEERAEYAMLLMRLGAVRESTRWLEGARDVPAAPLYRAFARITTWDYRLARADLREYLAQDLDPYQRRIGELNLAAAALYSGDVDEAGTAIRSVLAGTEGRLRANALEVHARILHESGDLAAAEDALAEAEGILRDAASYDQLFLMGLRAFFAGARAGGDLAPLASFREEARRRGRYESLREADWFELRLRPRQELFDHLYYGTPYVAFRRMIARGTGLEPADRAREWGEGEALLDLDPAGRPPPELKGKTGRLLRLLLSDRYRPFAPGALFQELYPSEYFDIHSSPARVKQLVYRLRTELARAWPQLRVEHSSSLYAAALAPGLRVRVGLEVDAYTALRGFLFQVRRRFGRDEFAARELGAALGLSPAAVRRRVEEALASGELERFGAGPGTRYRLSDRLQVAPLTHTLVRSAG